MKMERKTLAHKLRMMRNSTPKNPEIGKARATGYLIREKEELMYNEANKIHLQDLKIYQLKLWTRVNAEERLNHEILDVYLSCRKNEFIEDAKNTLLQGMHAIDEAYVKGLTENLKET